MTLDLLAELGARVESVTNEFGPERPTANKIACMQVPTDADKRVFMDSDMLGLREFEDDERFAVPFNAVPAYGQSFDQWDAAYAAVGLRTPPKSQPTLMSKEVTVPYFNSGFVSVDVDVEFGRTWLECMRAIVESESVAPSRFEDQASLALAVSSLELSYECLDEHFNYPQLHKPLDPRDLPYFCHYSQRALLRHEPILEETVASLVEEWPDLLGSMEADELWAPLARHYRSRRPVPDTGPRKKGHDVVITGIAGSGAGYLSDLLDAHDNCVVIREPRRRVQAGLRDPVPWPVAIFYRLERIRLIESGLDDEGLASGRAFDTGVETSKAIAGDGFVLATASTHPYLARLDGLGTVLPEARMVVCVRDPYDTIASWKRCAADRSMGDLVASGLVPRADDPWLTDEQRDTLARLEELNPAEVRARLWRHFAELILNQLDRVMVVNYDELAREPARVLDDVLKGFNAGEPSRPIAAAAPGGDRSSLDEADEQAIRAICSQAAFELGLAG